jgi:hypothetical protein
VIGAESGWAGAARMSARVFGRGHLYLGLAG